MLSDPAPSPSPSHPRSGKSFHLSPPPPPPSMAPTDETERSTPNLPRPSTDSVPLWSGNDPAYSVFTFIRRVKDAVDHTNFSSEEKVTFMRACMNCDTLTPSGAILEDDFYSSCTDFKSFCDQLIKEFACFSNDPCLASMANFLNTVHASVGSQSPRVAAGLAGRFKTELKHSLSQSPWLNDDGMMPGDYFINILGYLLFVNALTPDAAQLSKDLPFSPTSTIHDLKLLVEAKLRTRPYLEAHHAPASVTTQPSRPSDAPAHSMRHMAPRTLTGSRTDSSSRPPPSSYAKASKSLTCSRCKRSGHIASDCAAPAPTTQTSHTSQWCHYHKTHSHSADNCNFLKAQRAGRPRFFQ